VTRTTRGDHARAHPEDRRSRYARRERDSRLRRAVCQAALELVEESPFNEVTVDRITTEAGLSRSSFYLHFRDKYDVLTAMTEDVVDALYGEADRWWHGEGPPDELVRAALEGVVRIYAENATLLGAVAEVSSYDDGFRDFWRGLVARFVTATADHVRREQAVGRSRPVDPDPTADVLVWMTERSLYVHLARGRWSEQRVVEALLPVWLRTIYSDASGLT
jgi:TetR/AcrR family transcriptional regulator, ethionamide resistance regulator